MCGHFSYDGVVCASLHARRHECAHVPRSRMKRAQSTPHAMTALRQASIEPFGSLHGSNGYGAYMDEQRLKSRCVSLVRAPIMRPLPAAGVLQKSEDYVQNYAATWSSGPAQGISLTGCRFCLAWPHHPKSACGCQGKAILRRV